MPKIGDRVLYCYAKYDLDDKCQHLVGQSRPAVIVRDWANGHPSQTDPTAPCFNLHVFTDFANDNYDGTKHQAGGSYWATSRRLAATPTPGFFHYPPEES